MRTMGPSRSSKALFVDDRRDLAGNATRAHVFMQQDHLIRFAHRLRNRFAVERRKRAQVKDFQFDSFFRQELCGFERNVHHRSIGNDAEVATLPGNCAPCPEARCSPLLGLLP